MIKVDPQFNGNRAFNGLPMEEFFKEKIINLGRISLLCGIRNYVKTSLSFSEGLQISESDIKDEGLRSIRSLLQKTLTSVENEL